MHVSSKCVWHENLHLANGESSMAVYQEVWETNHPITWAIINSVFILFSSALDSSYFYI